MTDPIAIVHDNLSRRASGGFGGAIIIEIDNATELKEGYGRARTAPTVPFTPSTIAQVGSLTKQFTATAVVDLARRGVLKVTDTISRYLPRCHARQPASRSISC